MAGRDSYDAHLITIPSVSAPGRLPALYAAAWEPSSEKEEGGGGGICGGVGGGGGE